MFRSYISITLEDGTAELSSNRSEQVENRPGEERNFSTLSEGTPVSTCDTL